MEPHRLVSGPGSVSFVLAGRDSLLALPASRPTSGWKGGFGRQLIFCTVVARAVRHIATRGD